MFYFFTHFDYLCTIKLIINSYKMEENVKKLPLRSIICDMKIGDEVVYPRFQYSSVKSTASMLKMERNLIYKVSFNRTEKNVHIKRVR